jgi:hypothetical protein
MMTAQTDPDQDLLQSIAGLAPADQALVREYVAYLRWRSEHAAPNDRGAGRPWCYSFLENFAHADVRATKVTKGMEVKLAEAVVGGDRRPALWQHPPVNGEAQIEYHVPVPAGLKDLRLRAAIGIRDGGQGDEHLVAFRVRVDGWQVWSRAVYPRTWLPLEVKLPFQAGNVLRLTLATDGLGEHSWAWAVWADPELTGELAE